jgi:hypothetical protein
MQSDLKNKDSEAYKQKREIAVRAFESGCIIFSQDTRKWYTPREFMESDEKVVFKVLGLDKYSNFTLFYPKHAIEREMEKLYKAQADFDTFMKKVLDNFEISAKDLKTKK